MRKDIDRYQNAVSDEFSKRLRRFHILAGKPTLKEIEELSVDLPDIQDLRRSTVNDILQGKRTRIPEWKWLRSFVIVCRTHAERTDPSLGPLDTEEEWRREWRKAQIACVDTAPLPVQDPPPARTSGRLQKSRRKRQDRDEPAGRAAMLALTRRGHLMSWLRDYRDLVPDWFVPYLSLESAASRIRVYETTVVPDLLQTEAYARAVIRLEHPGADAAELDRRVELRLRRQRESRERDAVLWAVVDEDVLRHPGVPGSVMRDQIEALVTAGGRPGVTLQVMPSGDGTAGGPITLLRFPMSELPDVVYLEQVTGGLYPQAPNDVHHYSQVLDRLGIEANKPAETTSILKRMLEGPLPPAGDCR